MSHIVVIEDNQTMREGVIAALERLGHDVIGAASGSDGMALLKDQVVDLVITDFKMDHMDGLDVIRAVTNHDRDIDVLMMTAYGTIEVAVEAMKLGAADFVTKPFSPEVIQVKVGKILENRQLRVSNDNLREENAYLRGEIEAQFNCGEMVGESPVMKDVYAVVRKAGPTESSVLISGESGTGKELVARAIHQVSARKNGPFVKVNCGALPTELLESELFGHEKGAFTGASNQRRGRFELAQEGTIFLDEIGDLSLDAQVKLLRVLQEHEFERVGGEKTLFVDVRIVAATHRSLKDMVADGTFREDLYYRLEVIPIVLPPLRARKGDIPALVEHFLHKKSNHMGVSFRNVTREAMAVLVNYAWPGNVRELENVIERTLVLSDGEVIDTVDLPFDDAISSHIGGRSDAGLSDLGLNNRLDALERELICQALEKSEGVKTKAAALLGVKTSALYYKLDKYGLT